MTPTLESLQLPAPTYRALERIARVQGRTPADVVESFVQQFDEREHLAALRQEYRQLADKELARTITDEEKERIEWVAEQISDYEMQSPANRAWQQKAEEINTLIHDLRTTLEAFPNKHEATA
jgi:predicted transcriptional regulator